MTDWTFDRVLEMLVHTAIVLVCCFMAWVQLSHASMIEDGVIDGSAIRALVSGILWGTFAACWLVRQLFKNAASWRNGR